MPSQTINLQKRKRKSPQLNKWQKHLFITFIVLAVLLITSLLGMLVFEKTTVRSVQEQEANIAELKTEIDAHKNIEGLYVILSKRLKSILKFRQQQGIITELPELLNKTISPHGNLTNIQINESQFVIDIDTGRALKVEQVIQAIYSTLDKLEIKPKIIADRTEIDENGNHSLSLTISYNEKQSKTDLSDPSENEEIGTGI